jgi:molecular chaperone HtpG
MEPIRSGHSTLKPFPVLKFYLRAKAEKEEFFTAEYVAETAEHFGAFLPILITVIAGKQHTKINAPPPWEVGDLKGQSLRERLLEYGHDIFETDFLDAIPLQAGRRQNPGSRLRFAVRCNDDRSA